jgi:hypothetical protein
MPFTKSVLSVSNMVLARMLEPATCGEPVSRNGGACSRVGTRCYGGRREVRRIWDFDVSSGSAMQVREAAAYRRRRRAPAARAWRESAVRYHRLCAMSRALAESTRNATARKRSPCCHGRRLGRPDELRAARRACHRPADRTTGTRTGPAAPLPRHRRDPRRPAAPPIPAFPNRPSLPSRCPVPHCLRSAWPSWPSAPDSDGDAGRSGAVSLSSTTSVRNEQKSSRTEGSYCHGVMS